MKYTVKKCGSNGTFYAGEPDRTSGGAYYGPRESMWKMSREEASAVLISDREFYKSRHPDVTLKLVRLGEKAIDKAIAKVKERIATNDRMVKKSEEEGDATHAMCYRAFASASRVILDDLEQLQ